MNKKRLRDDPFANFPHERVPAHWASSRSTSDDPKREMCACISKCVRQGSFSIRSGHNHHLDCSATIAHYLCVVNLQFRSRAPNLEYLSQCQSTQCFLVFCTIVTNANLKGPQPWNVSGNFWLTKSISFHFWPPITELATVCSYSREASTKPSGHTKWGWGLPFCNMAIASKSTLFVCVCVCVCVRVCVCVCNRWRESSAHLYLFNKLV